MRLLRPTALLLGVVCALALWGCIYDNTLPPPIPPVPPNPVPPTPPPVPPETLFQRDIFKDVEVGGPASQVNALPPWRKKTTAEDTTIYSWVLDEPRPDGGYVRWEIHTEGDAVTASFPF